MRHLLTAFGVLAVLLFSALPASAEPTLLGPTGLLVIPTADITPADHMWIAVNFFDHNQNRMWLVNFTGAASKISRSAWAESIPPRAATE